jgi:hypothetical protein
MLNNTFTPEQIVAKLRQIEVLMSQRKTVLIAGKEAGIVDQTFYRWRNAASTTAPVAVGGGGIADLFVPARQAVCGSSRGWETTSESRRS